MNEFDCMPNNYNEWIYKSSMNKNNEQTLGQISHSWVKGKANISSTKPQIPRPQFPLPSQFLYILILINLRVNKIFCCYIQKLMIN